MSKKFIQKSTRPQKKRWVFSLPLALLVLLNFGQVLWANELSSSCSELGGLEEEKRILTKENQELKNQLSRVSSLSFIKQKASDLGMVSAIEGGVDYLTPALLASR